jgi:hypothetical protein
MYKAFVKQGCGGNQTSLYGLLNVYGLFASLPEKGNLARKLETLNLRYEPAMPCCCSIQILECPSNKGGGPLTKRVWVHRTSETTVHCEVINALQAPD